MAPGATPFLAGIRVLDMTHALAGPFCATILSDLGADVIKVERPEGDPNRRRGGAGEASIPFEVIHRNKRCIAIDVKRPGGSDLVRRLAAGCDVFLENFTPGTLRRHGLDHESLHADHPGLVYCSISGFGQDGPLSGAKGSDLIAQGYSGMMSVTGTAAGELVKAGYPAADVGAGMYAAIGVLAALRRRAQTGAGAYVDVSLVDTLVSWSLWEFAQFATTGHVPGPLGTCSPGLAPYQALRAGDGRWLTVAAAEDGAWRALCRVVGRDDLAGDERYATERGRFDNIGELAMQLERALGSRPRDEWIDELRAAGLACGPVHDVGELTGDAQLRARHMFVEVGDAPASVQVVNTAIKSDGAPGAIARAPGLGEHSAAILDEFGYDGDAIASLVTAGTVLLGSAPR